MKNHHPQLLNTFTFACSHRLSATTGRLLQLQSGYNSVSVTHIMCINKLTCILETWDCDSIHFLSLLLFVLMFYIPFCINMYSNNKRFNGEILPVISLQMILLFFYILNLFWSFCDPWNYLTPSYFLTDAPKDDSRKVDDDTVILSHVQSGSSAVYQCNASNEFGYLLANAFVSVLGESIPGSLSAGTSGEKRLENTVITARFCP